MEIIILGIFGVILLGCIALNISILIALGIGFAMFFAYGLMKQHSFMEMTHMALDGVKKVKKILVTFMLIGMLTALWRGAGTIPVIICYTAWMIKPGIFLLVAFLLNCFISFLTGTSFGTAATMGVICMTIGAAMGMNPVLVGGSIVSGIFFGDRCSPVSTSALLVCDLTQTDIFQNIKKMTAYAIVPFILTSVLYLVLGLFGEHSVGQVDVSRIFAQVFSIHWLALLPAGVILALSFFKVRVKTTMTVSIGVSIVICLLVQKMSVQEIGRLLIWGYHAPTESVAAMLDGGGLVSMIVVSSIVCLSSSYSGIFEGTHMLDNIQNYILSMQEHISVFGIITMIAVITSAISCNQTLAIMLTHQLCDKLEPDNQKMAIAMEDAPVIISPLIPWSIAGAVPIATMGAKPICLLFAFYLYFIPIWHWIVEKYRTRSIA